MYDCENCILRTMCFIEITGECEKALSEPVEQEPCDSCKERWECPVEKGGECVREGSESIAKRSTIKPE